MVNKESRLYPFIFAFIICSIASFMLASLSLKLKARQEMNVTLDVKRHIFDVLKLTPPLPKDVLPELALKIFNEKIEQVVLDASGNIVPGKKHEDIKEGEALYPLFIYREGGKVQGYCFPIKGKGLWSMLYGYLAIQPDGKTVRGISFYKQGETPGLGSEVESLGFQQNFEGKKIWDDALSQVEPVVVAKGKVSDRIPKEKWPYYVDGISGATMTGKGVTALLDHWIRVYEPFFQKQH
ncbi:MAG: NADH:ubiquinone reductase (Na(+)-transporting) subunit C [Candidatus Omnitrophica bacterium]|nr:NADH:ubiquinone reductase (Na(+)-transporting) subunit C [Candidatus Omnitrophota bacterium]